MTQRLRHDTMVNPPIEELLGRVDSKFTLVSLASRRAREINTYFNHLGEALGRLVPPQVTSVARKPLSIAFEEIAADKIAFRRIDPSELVEEVEVEEYEEAPALSAVDLLPRGDLALVEEAADEDLAVEEALVAAPDDAESAEAVEELVEVLDEEQVVEIADAEAVADVVESAELLEPAEVAEAVATAELLASGDETDAAEVEVIVAVEVVEEPEDS